MRTLKIQARKLMAIVSVIIAPLFLIGCVVDTFDAKLKIINTTTETIFVDLSKNNSFKSHPVSLDSAEGDTLWNYMRWVPPFDSLNNQPPSGSWEDYINKRCEDSTLTIFVFDNKLVRRVPRDSLILMQLFTKRFSYTVKDLEKLNWRVEYRK